MARYIDADALKEEWLLYNKQEYFSDVFIESIDDQPTADVAPVIHAHWVRHGKNDFECSNCKRIVFASPSVSVDLVNEWFKRCPECGAIMGEEKKK